MGYQGLGRCQGRLAPMFAEWPVTAALKDMAQSGAEEFKRLVVANTPIHDVDVHERRRRRPGTLRRSWYVEKPVKKRRTARGVAWEGVVATDDPVAPHVEWGTGLYGRRHAKYEIKPKRPGGWLFFWSRRAGHFIRTRRVMHPGSPGQAMVRLSGAKLETRLQAVLADDLKEWTRAQERAGR